ncbi:hypothetical protein PRK78_007524 [Emydomyces testavorans]|uniref:Uncharacterized protein n=1 Tax=Emydomyces testavorans TaxID=2070801 RepID=A0AAF0IQN1_9EURO|nr:hypothetical protein PRK78_007524 [Emydomyces testavorans]
MAPGDTRSDQELLNSWLLSEEVDEYIEIVLQGSYPLSDAETACKQKFAKLFYELKTSESMAKYGTIFLTLAIVLRCTVSFLKRSFAEIIQSRNGFKISFYILGELLAVGTMLIQLFHFHYRNRVVAAFFAMMSLVVDAISASYTKFGTKLNYVFALVAVGLKLVADLFTWVVSILPLAKEIKSCYRSGDREYGFVRVLLEGRPNDAMLWYELPPDYKLWALESLRRYLIEILRRRGLIGNSM